MNSCLLIKPGSLGDVIHALPVAAAIRAAHPACSLTWLVDERWAPLLDGNPHVSQTVIFPRQRFRGLSGKLRGALWARTLGTLRPECALDLQGLLRSALMARMSGARRCIGLSDAREGARWFYQTLTPVHDGEHAVTRYLRSLTTLGIAQPADPEFSLPPGSRPADFPETGPYTLLHPFARGAGKSLSEAAIAAFCSAFARRPVVLAGQGNAGVPLPANTINLLNRTTLSEMVWLIRHAQFVVSVDSGPMHIAAAAKTPLLSLHTWSDPRRVGPYNEEAWIWQGGEIRRQTLRLDVPLLPEKPLDTHALTAIAAFVSDLIRCQP